MKLEELVIYKISLEVGELVWQQVSEWETFDKQTVGMQFVNAADAISANVSQSFGSYQNEESGRHLNFANGSIYETKTWLEKAFNRNMITYDSYNEIFAQLSRLLDKLEQYIDKNQGVRVNKGGSYLGNRTEMN